MTAVSNSSRNLNIVLAVVVLFLGWLIASMIPRSEAPWDKTSSSYLTRRPLSEGGAEEGDLSGSAEYQELWSTDKENYDPQDKQVTIDYDSRFFPSGGGNPAPPRNEPSEPEANAVEQTQQWNDEIKVDSGSNPDLKIDPPPRWDDDVPLDTAGSDAGSLAPPLDSLSADWDEESPSDTEQAGNDADPPAPEPEESSAPPLVAQEQPDSEAEPAGSHLEDDASLFAQSGVSEKGASDRPEEPEGVKPLPLDGEGDLPAPMNSAETAALSEENQPEHSAVGPIPADLPSGGSNDPVSSGDLYALPTKRPSEQVSTGNETSPESQGTLFVQGGTAAGGTLTDPIDAAKALPSYKTLTPSNAEKTRVQESPPAGGNPISQVSTSLSEEPRQARAAYYEEPARPSPAAPTAISIYTAGAGENWDGIAAKFGLSPEESARYAETNSFRLNPDRTVTEGMKLILPKH